VNLGLAEAQLPGLELRAICWFEAYLALAPTAANAPAVRQEIAKLEARAEGNAARIIDMLKVLSAQMPSTPYETANPDIAGLLAASGDPTGAEDFVSNLQKTDNKDGARLEIVQALADLKRLPDAIREMDKIPDGYTKTQAKEAIISGEIAVGSYSEAKELLLYLGGPPRDRWAMDYDLAEAEYNAGQLEDAAAILRNIRPEVDNSGKGSRFGSEEFGMEIELTRLATAESKTGMQEDAEAIAAQVKEYAYNTLGGLDYFTKVRTPHFDRTCLLLLLEDYEYKTGRLSAASGLVGEAKTSCLERQRAHETFSGIESDEVRVLYGYESIKDWAGAKEWLDENQSNDDINYKYHLSELVKLESDDACASAKEAAMKRLADANSTPMQRAEAWSDYMRGCLSAALFTTDIGTSVAGLANFTPASDDTQPSQTIFDHVKEPAAELIGRLNDIRRMESISH
jgi:hypothetical protein